MSLRGFEVLRCDCGGSEVTQVFELKWKDGAGTSPSPAGWKCFSCSKSLDAERAIKLIKLAHLQRDIEAKQAELG